MQHEGLQVNNTVNMIGMIVSELTFSHEVYGEGFYNFELEVVRLSETTDILPVTISERLADRNTLMVGAFVHIVGQIRSYNNFVEANKKNRLILTVFAREIELINQEEEWNGQFHEQNPNDVFLDGFICKHPVYRTTPFGREIADILLAVNRSYNKSDYIPCIAWGRNARFAAKLSTADNVRIWGRMQSRSYQKKLEDGQVLDKVAYEISIGKLETPGSGFES